MANYAGSRANALINSIVIEEGGSNADMNAKMKNANEILLKNKRFSSRSAKEHNHASDKLRSHK